MKKIITLTILLITLLAMFSAANAKDAVESSSHIIEIKTEDDKVVVEETIILKGETDETFDTVNFWIQNGATDVKLESDVTAFTKVDQVDNVYTYSITDPDVTNNTDLIVSVSYTLPKDTKNFQKRLQVNNTASFTFKKDSEELFSASDLKKDSYINLELFEKTETPLTWYIIILIVLLIIILGVTALYSLKKQKKMKKKDKTVGGSEEFLNTKKTLLMALLKDIEKQHRAGKISDDTYHKLKDQYKQEAVETMRQLDDMK